MPAFRFRHPTEALPEEVVVGCAAVGGEPVLVGEDRDAVVVSDTGEDLALPPSLWRGCSFLREMTSSLTLVSLIKFSLLISPLRAAAAVSTGRLSLAESLTARLTGDLSDRGLHGWRRREAVPLRESQCNTRKHTLHTANGRITWSTRTR